MAKENEVKTEKTAGDAAVEKLRMELVDLSLSLIEEIRQKRAKNPEMIFNSLVNIYGVIK